MIINIVINKVMNDYYQAIVIYEGYDGQIYNFREMDETEDKVIKTATEKCNEFDKIMTEHAIKNSVVRNKKKNEKRRKYGIQL